MKGKQRRTLYTLGRHGDRVRVLIDSQRDRVEVLYRDVDGVARKKVFPNDKRGRDEATDWADVFKVERERVRQEREDPKPQPISLRHLWTAYASSPDWTALRPASQTSYRDRWKKWEQTMGREFVAGTLTLLDIDRFIAAATKAEMAINQVRQVLNVARIVYRWGQSRRLLATNDFALYRWRQPRDAKVQKPGQYGKAEWDKLLSHCEPQHPTFWRIHVALLLIGASGQRANAIRHLRWRDIETATGRLTWPAAWQKQGKDLDRALTWDFVAALETARYWRQQASQGRVRHDRKRGSRPGQLKRADWILFSQHQKAEAVSYQTLHSQLRRLEKLADVQHERFRAFHGGRRKVVTDIIRATGDRMLGLEFVGDTDASQLKSYDRGMDERLVAATSAVESVPNPYPNETTDGGADGKH